MASVDAALKDLVLPFVSQFRSSRDHHIITLPFIAHSTQPPVKSVRDHIDDYKSMFHAYIECFL